MQVTPITNKQWQSVLLNTIFAFVSVFLFDVLAKGSLDKATLWAAGAAGIMASLKIVEKALKTE